MRSAGVLLALGAAASAWVVPNQQVFAGLQPSEERQREAKEYFGAFFEEFKQGLHSGLQTAEDGWTHAKEEISELGSSAVSSAEDFVDELMEESVPYYDYGEEELSPHAEHPPHGSDKTIYQLLSESKYTTKFAKLIANHTEFKDLLNKTDANVTVFVPSDRAFEKIPDHAKEPPKGWIEQLLKHHILPEHYPAGRIFGSHTVPSLLEGEHLSEKPEESPQRLSIKLHLRGLYINDYNRITHRNIFASNGIIHGVQTFNIPPPPLGAIVSFLPTAFSTFELGLHKSGLGHIAHEPHLGATVFAPVNHAWRGLGIPANAFLFSRFGHKYLKALLAYHIVANQTLYSDQLYGGSKDESDATAIPKGRQHFNLPTLLHGKTVGVDVGRYGRFIDVHVNHYSKAIYQDLIGGDGVLHAINKVLIPPHDKKHESEQAVYDGGEISVEELKERLEPYVHCNHKDSEEDWESLEL